MHDLHVLTNATSSITQKTQSNPVALFVSDVHVRASAPGTTQAFLDFLGQQAVKTQHLYLLGDLFEYWAGDDDISDACNQQIVNAIRKVSDAGVAVFWLAGNRDFLTGVEFANATGATVLPDPSVVTICEQRIVLTHGDALCTDDHEYMAFRAKVRRPEWQHEFLTMPLIQRKTIIEGLRNDSRNAQQSKSYDIMDVNDEAIKALFNTTGANIMVHGHTHRPACHEYQEKENKRLRYVLPDWDCDEASPRGGWLAAGIDGRFRWFGFDGTELNNK